MNNPEEHEFDDLPIWSALLGIVVGALVILVVERLRGNI